MAARAEILGDTGANHPDHWVGRATARTSTPSSSFSPATSRSASAASGSTSNTPARFPGVEALSTLDLEAIPPLGYRARTLRLSRPAIPAGRSREPGTCRPPAPAPPSRRASFSSATRTRAASRPGLPQPEILSRNGSFLAYRRLQQHVGAFRDFLRQHGETPEEQELIAAKLMGRWRSGAPLVLAPDKDDPALGADMQRNNDFNYKEMDPHGYAVPLGAHIRRMNPRDTAANMNRRRMIRRGGTYGPPLPEGMPEDGVERGIAAFIGLRQPRPPIRVCPKRVGQ